MEFDMAFQTVESQLAGLEQKGSVFFLRGWGVERRRTETFFARTKSYFSHRICKSDNDDLTTTLRVREKSLFDIPVCVAIVFFSLSFN
jgi:hypothetical protein